MRLKFTSMSSLDNQNIPNLIHYGSNFIKIVFWARWGSNFIEWKNLFYKKNFY